MLAEMKYSTPSKTKSLDDCCYAICNPSRTSLTTHDAGAGHRRRDRVTSAPRVPHRSLFCQPVIIRVVVRTGLRGIVVIGRSGARSSVCLSNSESTPNQIGQTLRIHQSAAQAEKCGPLVETATQMQQQQQKHLHPHRRHRLS